MMRTDEGWFRAYVVTFPHGFSTITGGSLLLDLPRSLPPPAGRFGQRDRSSLIRSASLRGAATPLDPRGNLIQDAGHLHGGHGCVPALVAVLASGAVEGLLQRFRCQ